jgi:hypothetical protein
MKYYSNMQNVNMSCANHDLSLTIKLTLKFWNLHKNDHVINFMTFFAIVHFSMSISSRSWIIFLIIDAKKWYIQKKRHEIDHVIILVYVANMLEFKFSEYRFYGLWQDLTEDIQYSQRQSMINHCDRHITLLSDTDISFGLFNLLTYFLVHFGW